MSRNIGQVMDASLDESEVSQHPEEYPLAVLSKGERCYMWTLGRTQRLVPVKDPDTGQQETSTDVVLLQQGLTAPGDWHGALGCGQGGGSPRGGGQGHRDLIVHSGPWNTLQKTILLCSAFAFQNTAIIILW